MKTPPANTNASFVTETTDAYGRTVLTLGERSVTIRQNGSASDWMAFAHASDDEAGPLHRAFAGKLYKNEASVRRSATGWLRSFA